jgi:cytochrome c oxidase subunit II
MKAGPVLAAVVGVAAIAALVALLFLAQKPDDDVTVVDVTVGRYEYAPGSGPSLNVTLGEEVLLRVHSADVTHGFAITEYGINVEVPAGQTVEIRFRADHAGDFTIYCTVFCGSGHPQHKGTLHVA